MAVPSIKLLFLLCGAFSKSSNLNLNGQSMYLFNAVALNANLLITWFKYSCSDTL